MTTSETKILDREQHSEYLYSPLKKNFKTCVNITAYVILAVAKWKRLWIKRKKGDIAVNFPPAKFKVFNSNDVAEFKLQKFYKAR